jgi:glutamyl-tRNA synthetase
MGLSPVDSSVPVEILYAENRKIIDSEANRYFVIFNPMEISIKNAPKINKVKIPLHPDFPKRGDRTITPDFSKIYVEKEDFEKLNGQEVGLINLFSVRLGNETEFLSKKIKMESKKIQWLSEPNVKIKVVMPDGTERDGMAEPGIEKLKVDDMIQMQRIGFARVYKVGREITLYFAHK